MGDPGRRSSVVLDTNVVLDWLLFDDPAARDLGAAIVGHAVRWIATPGMRDEYLAVLQRPVWGRRSPDVALHRRTWASCCESVDAPPSVPRSPTAVRCTDADDQMFVDLAITARPDWLLSRDRALLSLAPRLRAYGVRVATPAAWTADWRGCDATAD